MSARLQDRVAVTTGGNSGIGLATAREFKANGAKLAIFGRNRQTLDEAAAALGNGALVVQGMSASSPTLTSSSMRPGRNSARLTSWWQMLASRNSRLCTACRNHSSTSSATSTSRALFHSSEGIAVSPRRSLGHSGECLRRGQTGASWHIDLHGCKGGPAVSGALTFRRTSATAHPRERNQPRHDRYADHYA